MSSTTRNTQWRKEPIIISIKVLVCSMLQQQLHYCQISSLSCSMQCTAHGFLQMNISSLLHQILCKFQMSILARQIKWSSSPLGKFSSDIWFVVKCLSVNVCSMSQEFLHHFQMSSLSCNEDSQRPHTPDKSVTGLSLS